MKHGILSVLTQGPAYGLQIRNELQHRLERARPINVGQVYTTIERLVRDGLAAQNAHTSDGLPLYALTEDGRHEASSWLNQPLADSAKPWDTMLAQVLMARSLPGVDAQPLIESYLLLWESRLSDAAGAELSDLADRELSRAAIAWLSAVRAAPSVPISVSQERPPKGRPRL